jgi:hypothetical protein
VNHYTIIAHGRLDQAVNAEKLDLIVDAAMDALLDLGMDAAAVSADLWDCSVDLEVGINADDDAEAFTEARGLILEAMRRVSEQGLISGSEESPEASETAEAWSREWNIRRDQFVDA